jgi:3'(2'), 5'-bisphosphate nucleotidase
MNLSIIRGSHVEPAMQAAHSIVYAAPAASAGRLRPFQDKGYPPLMTELKPLLTPLRQLIVDAGAAILEVYDSDQPLEVSDKADDSPVTRADIAAHRVIVKGLEALGLGYPVLSEEGGLASFEVRRTWSRYWLVDPLDGTKEFINRNGEFTVNIALIENGEPILGLVYVPVKSVLYVGGQGLGAFKEVNGVHQEIQARRLDPARTLNVVGSRRHGAEALDVLLAGIEGRFAGIELVSMGSSLKICALAEGTADWYPRLALTSEWDTAAAHAVLNAAGGAMFDEQLKPLRYNTRDSVLNPFFHAVADRDFDWRSLIAAAS